MAVLRLTVNAQVVDEFVPDFPFSVRREFTEVVGFEVEQVTGGGAVALPTSSIGTHQAIVLSSDKAVTVAMGNISLGAGGFILVFNGTPATSPPTVTNASGSTAKLRGMVMGQ